jgi:parvulin-like peptidyl-prolyl isomerase
MEMPSDQRLPSLSKKQKKAERKQFISQKQLSKWQRQMKIRRIVIIAAAVFLAGILSWVGFGYYQEEVAPFREVVLRVNNIPFTMGYYIDMLDIWTRDIEQEQLFSVISSMADIVATNIINAEVTRQSAPSLGIEVTREEIDQRVKENKFPEEKVYRDLASSMLWQEKLQQYFESQLPEVVEQAQIEVMLVESEEIAAEVARRLDAGDNFTLLADEFSCSSEFKGDLGWLPRELMPNALVADVAFSLTPGEVSPPVYDASAVKDVGYWIIRVEERKDNEIRAQGILVGSEVEAEKVRAELLRGGDFATLAGQYSQHESKAKGGDLGWLERGDMNSAAFDEVAFNLTVNEISFPVKDTSLETTGGYWIVKVVARGERSLEGENREKLRDKHWSEWFEQQKKNSQIENLLDEEKKSWAISQVLQRRYR